MRIALVAPPFIPVPPKVYGGTELFIAQLAEGLKKLGLDVVVYCNGESSIATEKRCIYQESQWPIKGEVYANLKDINHTAWAVKDASASCDVIHLNNLPGLVHSRFIETPIVYTIHHPYEVGLSAFYEFYPDINYVTISDFQRVREAMPKIRTIHHGIDLSLYRLQEKKDGYLTFLGRVAPIKGTHLAVEAAQKAGIPLKIAGEVQPIFQDYYDTMIKPHVDGRFIEYVGSADLAAKNELLGNSMAMLFPIQWDEPFGLVMIEAMACGTPVLALPGGSVAEVVKEGISGHICGNTDELAEAAKNAGNFNPAEIRTFVAEQFSLAAMVHRYAELYENILSRKPDELGEPPTKRSESTGHPIAA